MEWMLEPTAWVGLLTLILLEIVLGIDNLLFIAILVEKLPPGQRDRARIVGLSLALIMRLGLLAVMSWLVTLSQPLIHLLGQSYSGRDLILIAGGLFLIFKGTIELHQRIEQRTQHASSSRMYPSFWVIVLQIVILDAVFSIDSVITAVGMVDHLAIMMMAVTIAIGIMLLASKPLTVFVNRHPTVVILCLGFLLMIGFSLLAEGFGYHIPKGYLYAAIAFSVLIESANQLVRRNQRKAELRWPLRERTAQTVLRLLGKHALEDQDQAQTDPVKAGASLVFDDEERNMVSGVLKLSERNVHSIMTPRHDITWVDLFDTPEHQRELILNEPHSYLPVCRGSLDELVGVGNAKEMVAELARGQHIRLSQLRKPVIVPESVGVLALMDLLRESHGQLVLVADEFGSIIGVVTAIDILEAIAGEFPDEDETISIRALGPDEWLVDGAADLLQLEQVLGIDGLLLGHDEYGTLAGYLLERFGHLPKVGDRCDLNWVHVQIEFEVLALEGRRIATVAMRRQGSTEGFESV